MMASSWSGHGSSASAPVRRLFMIEFPMVVGPGFNGRATQLTVQQRLS
jgi:hypothetical protein